MMNQLRMRTDTVRSRCPPPPAKTQHPQAQRNTHKKSTRNLASQPDQQNGIRIR